MEKLSKLHFIMFGFILAGLLFSGYLAGVKFFSDTCAFGASCPLFLGQPACYTGFIVYSLLTVIAVLALAKKELAKLPLVFVTGISFFGVYFSALMTFKELSVFFNEGFVAFIKSLPLCSIGLLFFTVIFILSLKLGKHIAE
jgi:uncharacterized membrane protein